MAHFESRDTNEPSSEWPLIVVGHSLSSALLTQTGAGGGGGGTGRRAVLKQSPLVACGERSAVQTLGQVAAAPLANGRLRAAAGGRRMANGERR